MLRLSLGFLMVLLIACTTGSLKEPLVLTGTWREVSKNTGAARYESGPAETVLIRAFDFSSREAAETFATARRDSILARLSAEPDPYFGAKKPGFTCDARNRPVPESTSHGASFDLSIQLFASTTGVYGLCDEKLETQKSRVSWIFCAQDKQLFEVQEFFPKAEPWRVHAIVACVHPGP